ncbi:hypothetical protein D5S17_35510 [Pseudonocardiaceae bacterium YIM PH 21723]|nr:hypothetical protein D5S17_35510 [Pseudonocardiaceae bacterium YIM PH 21723]
MARRPTTPAPALTLDDALDAAARIRQRRATATPSDPDLVFFAWDRLPVDDDDVNATVDYITRHRRVPLPLLQDEVPDWALLVAYQQQRDTLHAARRRLAVLTTAHELKVPSTAYGTSLGLPTPPAVTRHRQRLHARFAMLDAVTGIDSATEQHLQQWLAEHAGPLRAVAEGLTDHRDLILRLAPPPREKLTEALDLIGLHLSPNPKPVLASAVSYAAQRLGPRGRNTITPGDPVLADILNQATELAAAYDLLHGLITPDTRGTP